MGGAPTKALEVNQSSASVSRTYSLNSCGLFPFHLAEAQLDPSTCFGGRHGSATDKKDAFPPHTSQTNTSYRSQLSRRRPLPKHVTHADARFSPFLAADTKRHGSYHAMSVNLIGPHAIASFRPLPPGDDTTMPFWVWSNSQTCCKVGSDKNWHFTYIQSRTQMKLPEIHSKYFHANSKSAAWKKIILIF